MTEKEKIDYLETQMVLVLRDLQARKPRVKKATSRLLAALAQDKQNGPGRGLEYTTDAPPGRLSPERLG